MKLMRILLGLAGAVAIIGSVIGLFMLFMIETATVHEGPVPMSKDDAAAPGFEQAVADGRRMARAVVLEENLPGLSIAVAVDGRIVWAQGFGWADIGAKKGVTPQTRFRIGGTSMALMSAAAGLLVDRERLDLDAPVQQYVPSFPRKQWPVTTRQLMAHVAGIHNQRASRGDIPASRCNDPVEGVKRFAADPLEFQPGTRHAYSNNGWILVSAAVQSAAGEPFLDFIRREVFTPLGMSATGTEVEDADDPHRAEVYHPRTSLDTRKGVERASETDYACFASSAAFLSTPSDLVRFGIAMNDAGLLRRETVTMLQTPVRLASGESTNYGLGWFEQQATVDGKPARVVGHGGTAFGGTSALRILPEQRVVVGITSNITFADKAVFALAIDLAERFAR